MDKLKAQIKQKQQINELYVNKNKSQREIAKELGISQSSVSRILTKRSCKLIAWVSYPAV
jgi:DNA-directed RNA polymerase specialized sigma subunit